MNRQKTSSFLGIMLFAFAIFFAGSKMVKTAPYPDGTLVKSPSYASVYEIQGGKRHAFVSEQVYHTWYATFGNVQTISDEQMGSITLAPPCK